MIEWSFVARHAIWICGAAVALAAWSLGRVENFNTTCRTAIRLGAALFCIGLGLLTPLWHAVIWMALALFACVDAWRVFEWHRQRL